MLSLSEVAKRYSVGRTTVDRYAKSGKLETVPDSSPTKVTIESCNACFGLPPADSKVLELEQKLDRLLHVFATEMKPRILASEAECVSLRDVVKALELRLHFAEDTIAELRGDL
jgi:hypothetical protein